MTTSPAASGSRRAERTDVKLVAGILLEAVTWMQDIGQPLWKPEEVSDAVVARDIGDFFIFEAGKEPVGVMKFQLEDKAVWPDIPGDDSAFVHRFAIRRRVSGSGLSGRMLAWAADRARGLGRSFLRLDCDASRPKLCAVYEKFGFVRHSERMVAPFAIRAGLEPEGRMIRLARYEYRLKLLN